MLSPEISSCLLKYSETSEHRAAMLKSAGFIRNEENAFPSSSVKVKFSFPTETLVLMVLLIQYPSKDFGAALTAPYLHQVSAENVTVPALTAAVPTVRAPPYVMSIGIPTKPPPSPPRLDGLTMQAL